MKRKYIIGLILLTAGLITGFAISWDLIYTDIYPFLSELSEGMRELVDPFPDMKPVWWTIGAIVFFFLSELATVLIVDQKSKTLSAQQSVNLLMGLKAGKILLSVFFVLIYAVAVKIEIKTFIMAFVLLYLIYLVFDTLYLLGREKEAKKEKLLTKE
ncbi:hypothetical protein FACS189451_11010 [Bacteroidia bacterium]|nr:hypothetical protein FACS189451_11010 [Bacteroidia bacterium]